MASYHRIQDSRDSEDLSLEPMQTSNGAGIRSTESSAPNSTLFPSAVDDPRSTSPSGTAPNEAFSPHTPTTLLSPPFVSSSEPRPSNRQPGVGWNLNTSVAPETTQHRRISSSSRHGENEFPSADVPHDDPTEPFLPPSGASSSTNPSFPAYDESGHLIPSSPDDFDSLGTTIRGSSSKSRPTSWISKHSASTRFSLGELTDEYVTSFRERKMWEPLFLQLWISVPLSLSFIGVAIASEIIWVHSRNNGGSKLRSGLRSSFR